MNIVNGMILIIILGLSSIIYLGNQAARKMSEYNIICEGKEGFLIRGKSRYYCIKNDVLIEKFNQ
jgi:hypothetical protein